MYIIYISYLLYILNIEYFVYHKWYIYSILSIYYAYYTVSWGGAHTKGIKGREYELTKKMFCFSDKLKLCLKKKEQHH